jgi:hypothetical protein
MSIETISIKIEDGNIHIDSNCSATNFMGAASVMMSSMVASSTNTLEELIEILTTNVNNIIDKNSLKLVDADKDEVITE